jgi:hypothetical protein
MIKTILIFLEFFFKERRSFAPISQTKCHENCTEENFEKKDTFLMKFFDKKMFKLKYFYCVRKKLNRSVEDNEFCCHV